AAIVVSGRICGAEFNCFGVVSYSASRVILQPSGLGAVIIWRVIFWIEFRRAVEISDSTIQIAVLRFFNPAVNEIAVGGVRRRRGKGGFRLVFLIRFPGVPNASVGMAQEPRTNGH